MSSRPVGTASVLRDLRVRSRWRSEASGGFVFSVWGVVLVSWAELGAVAFVFFGFGWHFELVEGSCSMFGPR